MPRRIMHGLLGFALLVTCGVGVAAQQTSEPKTGQTPEPKSGPIPDPPGGQTPSRHPFLRE